MKKGLVATGESPNMVAIMSGAIATDEPQGFTFRKGEVFPHDHFAVKAVPLYFVPADSTSEEIHAAQVKVQAMPLRGSSTLITRPVKAAGLKVV